MRRQMTDEELDRWNDAALDAIRGRDIQSDDPIYINGYEHGLIERRVRPVMPVRPEGYYHMPIGTFD